MKEEKKILSVQTSSSIIEKLKEVCTKEKRSQAKQLEVLIEEAYERLIKKE